jgi:PTS system nitrogen regulatory IIA component
MSIVDYLDTNQVLISVPSRSKKQVIEELTERVTTLTGLSQRCLLDMVMRRERLGSTGIGNGIAIPHAVHDDLTRTIALLAVLKTPVDFDAIDGQPVDIICLVVGPPNDDTNNLKCIASVTRSLQQASTCDKLRSVKSPEAVLRCLQVFGSVAA